MAFTKDSLVGHVLSEKPKCIVLFEKYVGRPVQTWEIAQAADMPLEMVAGYIGWNAEKLEEVIKELNSL